MIKNIEISRIRPHYNNPRKELGDLTELAESIKKTGILQNLTVCLGFQVLELEQRIRQYKKKWVILLLLVIGALLLLNLLV